MSVLNVNAQVVKEYKVVVKYAHGVDSTSIENYRKTPNIPAPVVKDGSIFYDGEFLLEGVKGLEIYDTVYFDKPQNEKKILNVVKYKNPIADKEVTIVYYPVWQDVEKGGFLNQNANENDIDSLKVETDSLEMDNKQGDLSSLEDKEITKIIQGVYEVHGKTLNKFENTGIKLVKNKVNSDFNEDFDIIPVDENSFDYVEIMSFNVSNGTFIIERSYNKSGKLVSKRIVRVHLE